MSVALATATDAVDAGRDQETQVIRTQAPPPPPPAGARAETNPAPMPAAVPRPSAPRSNRGTGMLSTIGTAAILAAVVLVFLIIVLPLIQRGGPGGAGDVASPTPLATATAVPNVVTVPDFVGQSTEDAIAAATEAGLDWTVNCDQDKQQPEGIIDQEPPAGTTVARGAKLSLYSARIKDCRG